jgi:hypothetical protein
MDYETVRFLQYHDHRIRHWIGIGIYIAHKVNLQQNICFNEEKCNFWIQQKVETMS